MPIKIKRIYLPYEPGDGYRILIDRLWPRGIKKEGSHIDTWMKDIAPSTELRKWYDHDPEKWEPFCKKYYTEIKGSAALEELKKKLREHATVTFLFSSKEEVYNHAIALKKYVE
ncbi:MAG: DUF488 family protein [Bacteroidota bacterium]